MKVELKSLESVLSKLKKRYAKDPNKPLGDGIIDLESLIRTLNKI